MNHEEKIIGMLEQLFVGQQEMKSDMQEMKSNIQQLNQRFSRIEVDHGQKLDALFDGYKMLSEKIDRLSVIDAMQMDIDTLKAAVSYLTNELAEIKKAM